MKVMNHINLNEYLFSVTSDYIDPNVAKTSLGVTVTMEITNVGTQGYPGVGKTSVLHLAIGTVLIHPLATWEQKELEWEVN